VDRRRPFGLNKCPFAPIVQTQWYAVHLFDRRTKKAMKRLKKLHKLNDHDRHRLRIAIKKTVLCDIFLREHLRRF